MRRTKQLAISWLRRMNVRKQADESGDEPVRAVRSRVTYAEISEELVDRYQSRGMRSRRRHTPRVLEHYASQLGKLLEYWGSRRISSTTEREIDRYVVHLQHEGLATSTIRNRLDRLSQCMQLAVMYRYIPEPPCRIDRPRVVLRSRPERISELDLGALLDFSARLPDRRPMLIFLLCADAGLRTSEVLRMRGEDLFLREYDGSQYGAVHVATENEIRRTKSARGRTVPILTARLAGELERRERSGSLAARSSMIAAVRTAAGITAIASRVWRPVLTGRARLHQLRRRFASELADGGVPITKIQLWMGHASMQTTQRYITIDATTPAGAGSVLEAKS
ncbi:MAG: tyrosine-type recombinase/integrase [Planctomycetes bacterium]|nr:tyrosine-type recombinase/integrase [Planctomycetota bacterium]